MTVIDKLGFGWFLFGWLVGIVWAIWNWRNPKMSSIDIFYGLIGGGFTAYLLIGVSPIILVWLISEGIGKLRPVKN
jgi:hypothetical protein